MNDDDLVPNESTKQAISMGIAVVAAHLDKDDDSSLAPTIVKSFIEDGVDPEHIICGLSTLCVTTLIMLKMAGIMDTPEALQFLARMYA